MQAVLEELSLEEGLVGSSVALPEDGSLTLHFVTSGSPEILPSLRKALVKAFSGDGGDRREGWVICYLNSAGQSG